MALARQSAARAEASRRFALRGPLPPTHRQHTLHHVRQRAQAQVKLVNCNTASLKSSHGSSFHVQANNKRRPAVSRRATPLCSHASLSRRSDNKGNPARDDATLSKSQPPPKPPQARANTPPNQTPINTANRHKKPGRERLHIFDDRDASVRGKSRQEGKQ